MRTFDFENARELAAAWLKLKNSEIEVEIVDAATVAKPYGWVFFYQSRTFLETGDFSDQLVGNAPILINRLSGEPRVLGTAKPAEYYLSEYELTIPELWLRGIPDSNKNCE